MIDNLRIDDLFVCWQKCVVEKPVNPMDGLRVECVGNRRDNEEPYNLLATVIATKDNNKII